MIRITWAALVVIVFATAALSGCGGPTTIITDSVIKAGQGQDSADLEKKVRKYFSADKALSGIKVSVARSNNALDLYTTRYSILLGGEVVEQSDHDRACDVLPSLLDADPSSLRIADNIKIAATGELAGKVSACSRAK